MSAGRHVIRRMLRETIDSLRAIGRDDVSIAEVIGLPVEVIRIVDRARRGAEMTELPLPPYHVFIGHDPREELAAAVCNFSIRRHSQAHVTLLGEQTARSLLGYDRPWHPDPANPVQRIDDRDGRPYSTQFAFCRFLAPAFCDYQGWALFIDSDTLLTADIGELFAYADPAMAVQVVKHRFAPPEGTKMDGVSQAPYPKKAWSSVMLLNNAHIANRELTVDLVNSAPGRWLHAFGWLSGAEIGALPASWNFLATRGAARLPDGRVPELIHMTDGGPWFPGDWSDVPYCELWEQERDMMRFPAPLAGHQLVREAAE